MLQYLYMHDISVVFASVVTLKGISESILRYDKLYNRQIFAPSCLPNYNGYIVYIVATLNIYVFLIFMALFRTRSKN